MKKNVLKMLIPACAIALTLAACGGNEAETKDYSSAFGDNNGQTQEQSDETPDSTDESEDNADVTPVSDEAFSFTYDGTKITLGSSYADVKAAIGDATSEFTQTTCAFEGVLNMYTYGSSFEIDETVPDDGDSFISAIYLTDDLVSTEEGLKVFQTKDDAVAIYGEANESGDTFLNYVKGNTVLRIVTDENGTITSIGYELLNVLQ